MAFKSWETKSILVSKSKILHHFIDSRAVLFWADPGLGFPGMVRMLGAEKNEKVFDTIHQEPYPLGN